MDSQLPPGPRLPEAVQALAYHRDPLGVLRRLKARYGPVFTLRFPLKDPLVFVAAPEALHDLLHADPGRAGAGSARRSILPQASPRSPFGADGAVHQDSRRRMWPAFAPERIEHLDSSIAELTRRHVDCWPTGRPFRVLEATRTLCTDITVRHVLGINDEPRRGELVRAIRALLNIPGNPPLPLPGTGDGPAGTAGRAGDRLFARRSREVRGLLADELHERRARAQPGDDVLGAMVSSAPALSDAEIIDELLIVLMAAQEPPGIALANVVYELGRRPEVAERFLTDAAARRAIIAEVIRLRPSASAALRTLREPMAVDGTTLPAGATVACPSPLLHRDPPWFPDPDGFRAERFAHGAPAHAPYFPFGGGARRCIGEALAEAEFRAALPVVLERLRFKQVWPREERMVVRATVLVPHRSALMQARRR